MSAMKTTMRRGSFVALALIFSSACYLYGLWQTVPGKSYTGIRSINASDYNENLYWIDQSRKGIVFLRNPYDSQEQKGFLIRPLYFLLSIPFHFSSLSNTVVLHVLRVGCGLVLLLALFRLLKAFTDDAKMAAIAFALLAFTSGAGILIRRWLPDSADLWIPEASLFLTLGETPHFIYSLFLLWTGVTCFYLATSGKRTLGVLFVAMALLWWEHPYDAVILIAVTAVNLRQLSRKLVYGVGVLAASLPPVLYYVHLRSVSSFRGWEAQNFLPSPSIASLLCGFLPLLLLSIWGAIQGKEERRIRLFLCSWVLIQFALAYSPFSFQRRLIFGVQFPLALLASFALHKWKVPAIAAVVLICSATNMLVMRQQITDLRTRGMPYYLPQTYQYAFGWLASRPDRDAVVSGFVTGNFIPGYTGHPVFLGHSALTPEIAKRKKELVSFLRTPHRDFLVRNRIRYIFCGLEEKCGSHMEKLFPKLYDSDGISIFEAGTSQ